MKEVMEKVEAMQAAQRAEAEKKAEAAGGQNGGKESGEEASDGIDVEAKPEITYDDFAKLQFQVGEIIACEAVPKSKKLLQFTLDDGTGTDRTILSGIHEYYEPEELVGKTCVAIVNLPPRKMMGIDSCGMLISAVYEYDGKEGLNLLMLDDQIPAGAKLY